MHEEEFLNAIGDMIENKLVPIQHEIHEIHQRLLSVEGNLSSVKVKVENDVDRNVQLLAEQSSFDHKRLNEVKVTLEQLNADVSVIRNVVVKQGADIIELRQTK